MNKFYLGAIVLLLFACSDRASVDQRMKNFPRQVEYVKEAPFRENFWIFILAGQSNMAGRGWVEPGDTVPSLKIYTLNKANQWVLAKEPLHYYEPNLTGLDCGLSFGKELTSLISDSIYIGIVPCAVGGSSIEQWLGDSLHREVRLFSNFKNQVEAASRAGTIKGILWHQGESNAHPEQFKNYKENLQSLFKQFRMVVQNDSLPILIGELGSFLKERKDGNYVDSVNQVLREISELDKHVSLIITDDFMHRGDTLHFNSDAQRLMGRRFAGKIKIK